MILREAPPVLVLAFNRPDSLRATLSHLVASHPSRVYVNVDGPRGHVVRDPVEVAACIEVVRQELAEVDTQLRTHSTNQGLGHGVRSAISWFFDHEDQGVILEDDILISPGSLDLAGSLLNKFANDSGVGSISLFSAVPRRFQQDPQATFRRSGMPPSWYWGSWRNRWRELITDFRQWRDLFPESYLRELGGSRFAGLYAGFCDADVDIEDVNWEGAWIGTHFSHRWSCVVTNKTYCIHTGYSESATHLNEQPSWQPTEFDVWDGVMRVPSNEGVDRRADYWSLDQRFILSAPKRAKSWLGRRFPGLRKAWRRYSVKAPAASID